MSKIKKIVYLALGVLIILKLVNIRDSIKTNDEVDTVAGIVENISNNSLSTKLIKIGFSELPDNVLGRCYVVPRVIQINPKIWTNLTDKSKILLVAHEMYHCSCYK